MAYKNTNISPKGIKPSKYEYTLVWSDGTTWTEKAKMVISEDNLKKSLLYSKLAYYPRAKGKMPASDIKLVDVIVKKIK